MEVNDALEKLGGIGRWQILHYTTLCIASSFTPCFHLFSILYIGKHTSLYFVVVVVLISVMQSLEQEAKLSLA